MSTEIKAVLDDLKSTHEAMKKANDQRYAEIEKFGKASAETEAKVATIATNVTALLEAKAAAEKAATENGERLSQIEIAIREGVNGKSAGDVKRAEEIKARRDAEGVYFRRCEDSGLKALSVNSQPDGGYLVNDDMNGRIVKRVFDTSPMRQVASVQSTSKEKLTGIYDIDQIDDSWETEEEETSNDKTPKLGKWSIPVHRQRAEPKATEEILEDADMDLESWLVGKIGDKFARGQNNAFVNGDGTKQPRGILTYGDGTTWGTIQRAASGASGAINPDAIVGLPLLLQAAYRANGRFAMSRVTLAEIMKLKDLQGRYLWQPSYQAGVPSTLQGFPVIEFDDMPPVAAGALAVAFADFREAYQVVDRRGVTILRDPYTGKPYVKFYARARTGGDVINFDAIKLIEIDA